jgi:prepilin-type N-terminal cleavage/methylation domain-containing protein
MKATDLMRTEKTAGMGRVPERRAFSLVELLTVMAIVAILSGATAMMFSDGRALGIRTSSALVSSTLSMARDLAVTSNRRTRFVVVTENAANPDEMRRKSFAVLQYDDTEGRFVVVSAFKQLPAGVYFSEDRTNEVAGQGIFNFRDQVLFRGNPVEYAFIEFLPSGGTKGTSGENIFSIEAGAGQGGETRADYARLGVAQHTGRVKVERN